MSALSNGGGAVAGDGYYNYGNNANLTATPNNGYYFTNWTDLDGNILSTSSTYVINNIQSDITIKVNFTRYNYYTVNVIAGEGGKVDGTGNYIQGSNVLLQATPDSNYRFDGWFAINGDRTSTLYEYSL